MFYVEQDYIVVNYFIDGGAARRFRKFDGAEHLRKLYPSLRDDEPLAEEQPQPRRKEPDRSVDTEISLTEFPELRLEILQPSDFSVQAPGVNFEQLAEIARRLASQPRQIPGREIIRMSIDEIERMGDLQLSSLMNDPSITDWDDAIWMRN